MIAPLPTAGLALAVVVLAGCSREPAGSTSPLHLRDVTAASGLAFVPTSGRAPWSQILEVKGGGLALIDFDGDDDLDVFVPNGATLDQPDAGPGCRLFENLGRLRFQDVTARSGLTLRRWSFGVAAGDVDGDGRDDLFVACYGRNALLRNLGGGRFEDVTDAAGLGASDAWSTAAAFGDVDRDGDLDLYVTNFIEFDPTQPPPPMKVLGVDVFGGPMGLPAQHDEFYENRGDGTFEDATLRSGCRAVEPGYGLGVVILDFDQDGRPEIFVGNDSGPNFLFRRPDDGPFTDVGMQSGIATNQEGSGQATMGIAIADVSGNGLADVYTSNFMNDTNTLHVNLGDLLFEDQTRRYGLGIETRPFLGWAAMFVDLDHDADEDLLVFNGHVYPPEVTEPHHWNHRQPPLLYERDGERFRLVAAEVAGSWLGEAHVDRSATFGDLDRDGDVDVVVLAPNEPLRVLENAGARGNWLVVALHDRTSLNPRGLGARIDLRAGQHHQVRWLHTGCSYQASNAPEVHFGLPAALDLVTLEVTWPDGAKQTIEPVATGRRVVVERDAP